ncbi:MAG: DNA-directed RNA polymerase subunit omega [Oscillospiraceae bacterium]|nr:DNA-directed RNA polymerase subunit omega [Oscillospiraceae bacterium]
MLKPAIAKLLNENESAYSLVIAIAKRSRDIAAEAQEDKVILDDKPVNMAIDEFGAHKYRVVKGHVTREE